MSTSHSSAAPEFQSIQGCHPREGGARRFLVWPLAPAFAELAREGLAAFFDRLGAHGVARALRELASDALVAARARLACDLRALTMPAEMRAVAFDLMEQLYAERYVVVDDAMAAWRRSKGCVACVRVVLVGARAGAYVGAFCDTCDALQATMPAPLAVCSSCEGEATNTLGEACEDCSGAGLVELVDGEPVAYGAGRLRAGALASPVGVGQRDVADFIARRMDADGEAVERPAPSRCASVEVLATGANPGAVA